MAALRDRRHEKVAQLLAVMTPYEQASREAGYKDGRSFRANARKRANRHDIKARVVELQSKQADLVEISVAWIKRELREIAGVRIDPDAVKPNEKIAALAQLAKMTEGALVPQKVQADDTGGLTITIRGGLPDSSATTTTEPDDNEPEQDGD